jgi:tetratricopeptide (TPR) repeat protein
LSRRNEEARRLLTRANALLARGLRPDAIAAYRQALALQPDTADAWFNLGYALRQEGAFEAAVHAYGEALRYRVAHAEEAHLNRAAIYADHLRRDDDAETELLAALAIAPDYAPALLNLGNLHEERGQRDSAADCYMRILALPRHAAGLHASEALARVVQLHQISNLDDPLLLQLLRATEDPSPIEDATRANLYFSLGRVFDALGEHDRGFSAFDAGKRLAHRQHPPYDPGRSEQRTQALIDAFPAPAVGTTAAYIPAPLFICGMFRSGSTLIEQVLAAHPDVATAGELDLLPRLVTGELAPFPASVAGIDDVRYTHLADEYHMRLLQRLPLHGEGKAYATDKRPDNYLLIGLVKRLFPHAKIVHTLRHPLDNGLSVFMQHLNPRVFAYAGSLAGIGHHYGQYRRLMAHWKMLYPDDIFDFDYDAFVAAPEASLRPLLDFLGLPWHPDCLAFHRQRNTVKTASYWQVRRPLYGDASGRWRHYRGHLEPLVDALAAQGIVTALPDDDPARRQESTSPR